MCPYFSACLCSITVCLQWIGVSYFLNRHVHTWSVFTYRPQFGTDDIEEQREHVDTQAELADPRSDPCWNVSQHCGQSILAAEEPRRSLGRKNDSNVSYCPLNFFVFCLTGFYFYTWDTWERVFSRDAASSYLLLAVGVADAWHVCVGKQEVECDRQERQVSHEGEILPVDDCLVQPVWEGEPVQSLAHTLQVGVSHAHGQIVIVQTLRRKDREISLISHMWHSNVVFYKHLQKRKSFLSYLFITCDTFSYSPLDEAKCRTCWNLWAPLPEPGASSKPSLIRFLKD